MVIVYVSSALVFVAVIILTLLVVVRVAILAGLSL
jgi:hypothetical protein